MDEQQKQPAYALCTFGQYFKLNHDLSITKGYDLNSDTERVFPMNPQAAKTNIQADGSYEPKLVASISAEIQMDYPETIEGLELINSYVPVDEPVHRMVVDLLESNVIDWTISHFIYATSRDEDMVLVVASELYDSLHTDVKAYLQQLGIKIEVGV